MPWCARTDGGDDGGVARELGQESEGRKGRQEKKAIALKLQAEGLNCKFGKRRGSFCPPRRWLPDKLKLLSAAPLVAARRHD